MEHKFLYAPVQDFGDIYFVLRWTGNFVNPAELFRLPSGFPQDAEDFAIKCELVHAAGKCIRGVQVLIRPRSDAEGPGRAALSKSLLRGRRGAHPRFCVWGYRHIDFHFAEELA